MKFCPQCGTQLDDAAVTCTNCGASVATPVAVAPVVAPYDHTAEFDAKDISDNKVIAMCVYLLGVFGIIIAALCSADSAYIKFHVRQALKLLVCETLLAIVTLLLVWTIIIPIVGGIALLVVAVLNIICFFNVCSGKAIEPAIIRNLGFLK